MQIARHCFVGAKGMLIADYNRYVLLLKKEFAGFRRPLAHHPGFHRPSARMDCGLQNGPPDHLQFRLFRSVDGGRLLCNVALRTGKKTP